MHGLPSGAAQLSDLRRRLDRGLDRARDPTFRCTALGESASNFDPHPDSGAKRLNNEEIGESRENMIGVRS